jgi:hypothetical protein
LRTTKQENIIKPFNASSSSRSDNLPTILKTLLKFIIN